VGERRFTKAELADYWFHRYPQEYGRTLDEMLDEWVTWSDARRLGLSVPPERLAEAVAREVDARRRQLEGVYGPEISLEEEVRRAYGLDLAAWRAQVLEPRLRSHLLMERVIRADTRRRERVHARVIVFDDEARAGQVAAQARAGADFSLLAGKESRDPSARAGGDLPWIARGDLRDADLESRLFAAAPGALVGPLRVVGEETARWHLYKVVERLEAWDAPTSARLEEDLVRRPVDSGEFERWRARVRRDRAVRAFRPDGGVWERPSR
jgi:peptidyl-prolyl cis-trans isomerase C